MRLDWLLDRFATACDTVAFVHEDRSVTYGELVDQVVAFERRLADEGVKSRERVVILGDYSPEAFSLVLALARHGNVVIPLTRESVVELSSALSISGCDWIFEFAGGITVPTLTRHAV